VLPWSAFWERNYFAAAWPPLQRVLTNNFVRGAVTGLGLVNLFAGFADLALVLAGRPRSTSGRGDGRSEFIDRRHEMPVGDRGGRP
jgi:hypothetical protein